MAKSRKNYRNVSLRAQWWDYGWNAAYFVTMNIRYRVRYFGCVVNRKMQLSDAGDLANKLWESLPGQFSYVRLGVCVVMPDHMHGIVLIEKPKTNIDEIDAMMSLQVHELPVASSHRGGVTGERNPMLHDNLSRAMRWYKGRATFEIRKIHPAFEWQSRFHEHIIRNKAQYRSIERYIINNPAKWKDKG